MVRKEKKLPFLFFWGFLILLSAGCQPFKGRGEPAPLYDGLGSCIKPEAVVSLAPKEKKTCIRMLEAFLEGRPSDPAADQVSLQLGRFYMNREDFSAAYHLFSIFPERYPESPRMTLTRLCLGICLYYMDNPRESLEILHSLAENPEAEPYDAEIARYIAENYIKMNNLLSALAWYQRCDAAMKDTEEREKLHHRILDVMSLGWESDVLQRAAELFPEGFFSEVIRFGVAATCYKNRQVRLSETHLLKMSDRHPDDVFTPHIAALLEKVSSDSLPRVCTVGCLLPLTGKYGRFGENILDALLLGARAFTPSDSESASIRLLIRDTRGDPDVAVHRLRELAEDGEVIGVVGPLLATVAQACAAEAQQLGIPMMTLTQREDVARVGDYIFQNGLTIRQQVETLLDYVMDDLGISSLSVLYPDNDYGRLARSLFEDTVLEKGGEVISSVSYEEEETDFQEEIRLLVGETYWEEMKSREKLKGKKNVLLVESGTDEEGRNAPEDSKTGEPAGGSEDPWKVEEMEEEPLLPPFEALFVPDNYPKVSLIAPHLAFYDLNEIVLLGNSAWNSSHLVERAGEYVRDAVFVDGFFAESAMPHVRDFVEEYRTTFQRDPRVLEAQGYDSLLIFEEAFHQAHPKTRDRVRSVLSLMEGYPGLSGYTRFDEAGCAKKRLYLLSVIQNRIQQIY